MPRRSPWTLELSQARLRPPVGGAGARAGPGVLTQHTEQAAHLRQCGPGGVADVQQPFGPLGGHARGGQPGRLGLHSDHGDVMGDDIVQLTGDACAFLACGVLHEGAGHDLPGGRVLQGLSARPLREPGKGRCRGQRSQQHRTHPEAGVHRSRRREHHERQTDNDGEELGAVAAEAVPGDQLCAAARQRHRLEERERPYAREVATIRSRSEGRTKGPEPVLVPHPGHRGLAGDGGSGVLGKDGKHGT